MKIKFHLEFYGSIIRYSNGFMPSEATHSDIRKEANSSVELSPSEIRNRGSEGEPCFPFSVCAHSPFTMDISLCGAT